MRPVQLTAVLCADSRTKEQLLQVRNELLADNRALRLEVEELRDGMNEIVRKFDEWEVPFTLANLRRLINNMMKRRT